MEENRFQVTSIMQDQRFNLAHVFVKADMQKKKKKKVKWINKGHCLKCIQHDKQGVTYDTQISSVKTTLSEQERLP